MKVLVLENIRSAYNVGAMFRTADAAGVSKVYLVGYTPQPIDRFGRVQKEIQKTSLGAAAELSWKYAETIEQAIADVRAAGCVVVAIEQAENAVSLEQFVVPPRVAYILGNEVDGVSQATLEAADVTVEVPMHGKKESLNVSVTAGIVLYHGLGS